jgi:hypothetical protein
VQPCDGFLLKEKNEELSGLITVSRGAWQSPHRAQGGFKKSIA